MRKIIALLSSLLFLTLIFTIPNVKAETYNIGHKYKKGEYLYELKKIIEPARFMEILTTASTSSTSDYIIYPDLPDEKVYVTIDNLNALVEAEIEKEYVSVPDTGLPGMVSQKLKFNYSVDSTGTVGIFSIKNNQEWSAFANVVNGAVDLQGKSLYIFTRQIYPTVLTYKDKYDLDISNKKRIEEIKSDINFKTQFQGQIIITKDTYSANFNVHGQYEIKFKVKDLTTNLESEEKTIIMNVVDPNKIFIHGPNEIKAEVKTTIDLDFLKQYYTATKGDEDFTNQLVSETNLDGIANTLGTKTIVLKATDSVNIFSKTINLIVEDTTAPTIEGPNEVSLLTNKDNNVAEILKKYSFSDNYNSNEELQITTIPETINQSVLHLTIICKDKSNNESRKIVRIRFVDAIAPKIEGPTTIYKGQRDYITTNYIKSLMTAHDETDGNLNNLLEVELDELTGFSNVSGTYNTVFAVKDSANNVSKKTVKVIVNKQIENYVIVDNTIMISSTHQLNKENLVKAIEIMKDTQIAVDGTSVAFSNKLEEYIENYQKVGYKIEDLELTYNKLDGTSAVVKFNVEVVRNTLFGKAKENVFKTVAYYILGISAMGFLILVAVKVSKRRRGKRR